MRTLAVGAPRALHHQLLARAGVAPAAAAGVAIVVMCVALVVGGGAPQAALAGLADPGPVVRWGAPILRLLGIACAIGTVGALLVAGVLAPIRDASDAGAAALRAAPSWAAAWAVSALAAAVVAVSDVTAIPLGRLGFAEVRAAAWSFPGTRALLLTAALCGGAAAVAAWARSAGPSRRRDGARGALVLAVVALAPTIYVGHSAHGGDQRLATGAMVVHAVSATGWIGGLAGLAWFLGPTDRELVPAVTRFSSVALGCYVALVGSGAVAAVSGLGTGLEGWRSTYAALLVAKAAVALALGALGWCHRRWTIDRLAAGRPGAFTRLVAAELVLMGAAVGLAVALARTPGATSNALERSLQVLPPGVVRPISGWDLVWDWRPEPVLTALVLVALAGYVHLVRGRTARGHPGVWSLGRSAAAASAAVAVIVVVGLPVSFDETPLRAVQTAQHLVLALVVPALALRMGLGALRPGRGAGSTPRVPAVDERASGGGMRPAAGCAAFVVATVLALSGPLSLAAASSPAGHVLSLLLSASTGLIVARSVLGIDLGGERRLAPSARERVPALVLILCYLVGLGVVVALRGATSGAPGPVLETGLRSLLLPSDQHLAAWLIWAAVAAVGPLTLRELRRGLPAGGGTRPAIAGAPNAREPGGRVKTMPNR